MRRRPDSLLRQTVAANMAVVVGTLFAATISAAAGLDLSAETSRRQFGLLALAVMLTLLLNVLVLRRRFRPLERLAEDVARIDAACTADFRPSRPSGSHEVDALAASFAALLERVESERRQASRLAARAQEAERARIARDLHDEVNQALTAITLRLEVLGHDAPPVLREELQEVKRLAGQAMDELLALARQLRPTALDDHGLIPAVDERLRRLESESRITTKLDVIGPLPELDPEQQVAVYRVVQEALSNAVQHAGADTITVRLGPAGAGARVEVADDGAGFDPRRADGGLGLAGMSERARLAGGTLAVDSAPGRGTRVVLTVA